MNIEDVLTWNTKCDEGIVEFIDDNGKVIGTKYIDEIVEDFIIFEKNLKKIKELIE